MPNELLNALQKRIEAVIKGKSFAVKMAVIFKI